MRDENMEKIKNSPVSKFVSARRKELLILLAVAAMLGFAVWGVFGNAKTEKTNAAAVLNATEQKLCVLLREMDGVGEAEVMICETEDGVQSVVVVCDGADDLRVVMQIREAVAAALGTEEKAVKIYLKKD